MLILLNQLLLQEVYFLRELLKICSLPSTSGLLITICLSNLPGLNRALSKMSGLLVAAITIMFVFSSGKPHQADAGRGEGAPENARRPGQASDRRGDRWRRTPR